MNSVLPNEVNEVLTAMHYRPAVSIILPFEPKMILKNELLLVMKLAAAKVSDELYKDYPVETARLVMLKLENIIRNLNFNTHKKSIAIYVSPVFEKVLYLDIAVEEKIIVDDSFEIRDLVYCKKQFHKYLLLLLSGKESRMYIGNSESFVSIVSDHPASMEEVRNDAPEKVSNFSDPSARKEVIMNKFLLQIDNALDIILNAYHLPLFVMGTEKIMGHFKKLTRHSKAVIEYIPGNYDEMPVNELRKVLQPRLNDWKNVMQKDLLNQLEDAGGKKKLATGIKSVWEQSMNRKGRLLVVEKNYMYATDPTSPEDTIFKGIESYSKFSYIKDAVDDVIEKVLENGGDVEFVDMDVLINYDHIALVLFY